ncbi:membrane-associated guanylate kinase, WW and PDZ domain-containing protein 3 isoform X3 [Denticeps clupeoides]|nr:membrane-associated guanylate kinase, WW and PDZ domain-containing protein 3-like isoform X3 [Denticeps clupeoides]XP_028850258.1 membrane-associated guanylate kinase, WW and PDZ domain-containing protein 3-like isoform X3 [Denticeps clupeoides]
MSKAAVKKLHWRSKVQDSFIPLVGASGDLGVAIGGGADYGEFPFITATPGGGTTVGDIILEIGGTPVLGMTLGDVRGVLNSCPHPIRIKTVSPGSTLCKDLRLYLSKCFTPGSMDCQLQQVIRENLYLRAVPCTTRRPRDGEIAGVDYNFVSIEEFFSLEESGALLESGKFKGNYYGTPRPVHISPDSPPITYQEHRNLLRNFRTRSKSLSNLEKAVEDGENSEEDSGLPAGISRVPMPTHSPGRSQGSIRGSAAGGLDNGVVRSSPRRAASSEAWEMVYDDSGDTYYTDRDSKTSSWLEPRPHSRASAIMEGDLFTKKPGELRGYSVHSRLSKGPRGFGFNIVGGSRPREFLQVYSITPGGPSALKTADILVYINDLCVLGVSHREVVEMLKAVPVGHSVDVVVRRGYPMLYNQDGVLKQPQPDLPMAPPPLPTTTQPQSLLPQPQSHLSLNGIAAHSEEPYFAMQGRRAGRLSLDASGDAPQVFMHHVPPSHPSYANGGGMGRPRSSRRLFHLQGVQDNLASQSDSEVVSAIGSHRASLIRNHNNNSLSAPPPLRHSSAKSSESDLSSYAPTLPVSRLHLPQPEIGLQTPPAPPSSSSITSSPGRRYSSSSGSYHQVRPQPSLLTPPLPAHGQDPSPCRFSFNGRTTSMSSGGGSPVASSPSPGALSGGSGGGLRGRGELVPVALPQQLEAGGGLGFSVTAGGQGGRRTLVKRVWDRRQCPGLQPGDAIVKINGADVQTLSLVQVQRILQEHTQRGEVILLVYRGASPHAPISPASIHRLRPPSSPQLIREDLTPPPDAVVPRTSMTPPPPSLVRTSLVQSTSFLDSVPVTLTMEPRDWQSADEARPSTLSPRVRDVKERERQRQSPLRGFQVELKRKSGEGFGFVIASQDVENGHATSLLPHRFVTVRRGSPAARSGQIRPGDRLEAVDGRSVVRLPHGELAQILRRAGNTLRLTIVPRSSAHASETTDYEPNHRTRKGHRSRPKQDSRYYSVDLERGSTGFGFSLRGGSEYNMGLYVLGLMEGGPASRSHKIQVSDQLVEINGNSTAGMTHSQAVEQIRAAGHTIHLVLKKGNGYVPDYVELSSLSLCMTNSKLGEPCFYVIGRTENTRLVVVPVSSPFFCFSTSLSLLTLKCPAVCCHLDPVPPHFSVIVQLSSLRSPCPACLLSGIKQPNQKSRPGVGSL